VCQKEAQFSPQFARRSPIRPGRLQDLERIDEFVIRAPWGATLLWLRAQSTVAPGDRILDPMEFTNGTRHEQAVAHAERHEDMCAAAWAANAWLRRCDETRRIDEMVARPAHALGNARSAAARSPSNALPDGDFLRARALLVSRLHPRWLHGSSEAHHARGRDLPALRFEAPHRPDRGAVTAKGASPGDRPERLESHVTAV
jgi:hypothetical protein